jgi:hypothetical protein
MSTEDYNRGYSGQAPLPGGGLVAGEAYAQGVVDSQRRQPGHSDKTSSAVTLLILGVPLLVFWAAAGGESGGAATAFAWGIILICLVGASLGAGLVTFVALSLLVALSKTPGRFGSPRRAFVYAAMVSLLGGGALMWMGLESVAQVAKDGAAASGLVTALAGGIGRLIWVADLPLVHGLWESRALDVVQGIGGAGSLLAAALMLAVPVLAFTFALRRLCGTGMALALGTLTQAGIAFLVVAMLSSAFQQL